MSWIRSRFSRKIALFAAGTLAISMGLSGYLITRRVKSQFTNELASSLELQAHLILARAKPNSFLKGPDQELQKLAIESSRDCGARVTFISANGTVVADSDVPFAQLSSVENHAARPEIQQALHGIGGEAVRHSHTVNRDLLYQSVPVEGPHGIIGVVRLAVNLDSVQLKLAGVRENIVRLTIAVGLGALLIIFWISRIVRDRLENLSETALALSQGRYQARVVTKSTDEFGTFGETFNFLAQKIQTTVEDLSRDKTQLAAILSNMVEAVVAVEKNGRILAINPALAMLFGLREKEALGQPFLDVLRHSQLNELIHQVLIDGQDRVDEVRAFQPVERLFEAHAVPLWVNGSKEGALLVLHDITRLRQLEQIRRDFVANVSHELRTPLAAIKGFAETLKMGAVDDKQNRMEFLTGIEKHTEQMTQLIDDLLDLAAIESGKRAPQPSPVHIDEIAQEVLASLRPLADRKGVTLTLQATVKIPAVAADRLQIKQVFMNLIDNAIKFNKEKGSVDISFEPWPDRLVVFVKDTGSGIPPEALPRVFERFFRVDKARSKEMGGTGLGLAIVKHIIEAHRGTVAVESTEGHGSTFHFSLPR